jgi:nucleoside-diphosphate-sugar epimerase
MIINSADRVLVTGSTGFLGSRVVASLLDHGFRTIRCFARQSSNLGRVEAAARRRDAAIDMMRVTAVLREDCERATKRCERICHLAAGPREMSFLGRLLESR